MPGNILQQTCLKQTYPLRKQLMLSFGSSSFIAIATVVTLAVVFAQLAGNRVQDQAGRVLQDQIVASFVSSSTHASERMSYRFLREEGSVQLIVEATRDRIMGYPNPGWEDDAFVPFFDTDTQRNMYPLRMPPAALHWNVTSNVGREDYYEHVQKKFGDLSNPDLPLPEISTAGGVYFMQGTCDPNENNPTEKFYHQYCSARNNDWETGGALQPTPTNRHLYEVSGDLVATIKPIYEAEPWFFLAGVWFSNSGAGSSVWYPGYVPPVGEYESEGCDWMAATNPNNGQHYAAPEEISRCHPQGDVVSPREWNALEQRWYRECITAEHGDVTWHGPFDPFNAGNSLVSACRGVFDRLTGRMIGAAVAHIHSRDVDQDLYNSLLFGGSSEIAMVRYDDGTLFADTMNLTKPEHLIPIYETGFIAEEMFLQLKNGFAWNQPYDESELQTALETNYIVAQDGVYTGNYVPIPPAEYDPSYRPKFLMLHFVANEYVFSAVDEMEDRIQDDFVQVGVLAGCLGIAGMLAIFLIVWLVSSSLTKPLIWIDSTSWSIFNPTDEQAKKFLRVEDGAEISGGNPPICAIHTEVTWLVKEFKALMKGFSGGGPSTVATTAEFEISNEMSWHSDFHQLYAMKELKKATVSRFSPETESFSNGEQRSHSKSTLSSPALADDAGPSRQEHSGTTSSAARPVASTVVPAPRKKNLGRNILRQGTAPMTESSAISQLVLRSSLFWRILGLIAVPCIITNVMICAIVSKQIVSTMPDWVVVVEEASLELEANLLNTTADLKASVTNDIVHDLVRDLHVMTRTSTWLFFGGLERSGMLVDMDEQTEDCKMFPADRSCPFFSTDRAQCPCDWEDRELGGACTEFPPSENTRAKQHVYWHIMRHDADPETGDRYSSPSFPEVSSSANTTQWWNTTDDLPGSFKGSSAEGFETAYDRIRVSSSLTLSYMPLYFYKTSLQQARRTLGLYIGLEQDGAFVGFDGCDRIYTFHSHWSSSESNKAAEVAPELCPIGFHGYDPRCRGWYHTGKRRQLEEGKYLYFTTPYQFNGQNGVGTSTSATSPLYNPVTGEYLGQALLDFEATEIRDALRRLRQTSSLVITPVPYSTGGNTLVGPDKTILGWEDADILDLLFVNETENSGNREDFESTVLADMMVGGSNITSFRRWTEGTKEETFFVSYRPVHVTGRQGIDPSDFSRGVSETETHVYSVAFFTREDGLRQPFNEIREDVANDLEEIRLVYIVLVLLVSVLFTAFTCMITAKIVEPIILLLRIVRGINSGKIENGFPPLPGGSKEVSLVYNSFTKLVKIVRMSNMSFFSGNLEWAHNMVSDALKLFRQIGDQKAIGIACNNLGSVKCALLSELRPTLASSEIEPFNHEYGTALAHFDEAVEISERQLDDAPEGLQVDHAQQLANRLFNRFLLHLVAVNRGIGGDESKVLAMEDLKRVRELDNKVMTLWLERKVLLEKTSLYFERLLRRAHGLIDLAEDEDLRTLWDPKELIGEAEKVLYAAWNNAKAEFFNEFSSVGRLQQLEAAAMRLDISCGRKLEAAQLAMRMFAEDEYVLEGSFGVAAKALSQFMRHDLSSSWSDKTKPAVRKDIRRMAKSCRSRSVDLGKAIAVGFEINESLEGDPLLDMIHNNCLWLYDNYCSFEDHFGFVSYSVRGEMRIDLAPKAEEHVRQRATLDLATWLTSDRVSPAFPYVIQMLLDSAASAENDSYAILIADGNSWDPAAYMPVRQQIERHNDKNHTLVHVFIIGVGVEEDEVIQEYKHLAAVTKSSVYINATAENIDATFDRLASIMSGSALTASTLRSLTLEKF